MLCEVARERRRREEESKGEKRSQRERKTKYATHHGDSLRKHHDSVFLRSEHAVLPVAQHALPGPRWGGLLCKTV